MDYWVVTGPLNDGWKIRRHKQCLALINSILSGPCAVVRAASDNRRFEAWDNVLLWAYWIFVKNFHPEEWKNFARVSALCFKTKRWNSLRLQCYVTFTKDTEKTHWPDQPDMPRCCWTPTWFTSTCSFSRFRTWALHSPFHSLSQRARAREGGRGPSFRLGLINAWIIFTSFHLREFCFLSASLNHSAWKRFLSHPPATHTPSLAFPPSSIPFPYLLCNPLSALLYIGESAPHPCLHL